MRSHILKWIPLLMTLNLITPCPCFSSGEDDFNNTGEDMSGSGDVSFQCPQQKSVVFTVIQRHPYARNDTGIMTLPDLIDLDMMASSLFEKCTCFSNTSVEIKVAENRSQLEKIVTANQTDFGFPVFSPVGSKKVFKKPFFEFTSHPGFDLFIVYKQDDPVQVCIDTLLSSWPILALSVTFTGMAGIVIWICETMHNREEFPMSFTRGSWEGFWWAFISMTTVGYGDKCPRSIVGRCFSVVWIIGGLVLVSVFMANVTTALTSANKPLIIQQINEMDKVGVLENSIDETFAKDKGAQTKGFTSFEDMIQALVNKDVDGILLDRFVMGYHMTNRTNEWHLTRIKQFPGSTYRIGAVSTNPHAQKILETCGQRIDHDGYSYFDKSEINHSMANYGNKFVKKGYKELKQKPSSDKSFNLFIESKETLKRTTLISCCVLASLVTIGALLDFIASRKRQTTTREHKLKTTDNEELLRDIQKSKAMLKDLQSFLQELEEKITKKQSRYVFINEAFVKR